LIYALTGRAGEADRWAAAAERTELTGVLPDGNTMEGSLAYLRTLLCRDGIDAMRIDARLALDGLRATSPYRPAMLHALGAADLLQRDPDRADVLFARAYDEAVSAGVVPFVPVALAERGMLAIERGEWDRAGTWADEAIALMAGGQFDDYWTSALVYAWVARVATHRGEAAQARDLVTRAARLRPLLTYALPILATQALRELANAYIALTEPAGAQAALRQIRDIQQHRPDLGTMYADADELRVRLDALKVESLGLSSLTTAELRLLPMLSTHLSLAEISERLYVSRNTVKTQTISIYRKLGVTTRGEAVSRLQQHGVVVA
jgi:LuxR family maltose regulon positive regulatory protein